MDNENVNHPNHYGGEKNPYEVIKIIEALELSFSSGNALKYMLRSGKKFSDKTVEDLEKAIWYLKRSVLDSRHLVQSQPSGSSYSTCNICLNVDVSENIRVATRYLVEERPTSAIKMVEKEINRLKNETNKTRR
jgi:hypothetical protein